ncbi:hypothetical protein KS4_03670 [Poriferisphaera corsica]|uniref:Uncharacterized protein n=1 Tax=Poriferisphaera corsica TaxID=2528020 RepID=A0A517YQ34_9BACT|nr:hypothetical protein [Poriferisphaera corsica]QDU32335.1 hypothetical protein KS4_03670 [Poriferisphaera corsica]
MKREMKQENDVLCDDVMAELYEGEATAGEEMRAVVEGIREMQGHEGLSADFEARVLWGLKEEGLVADEANGEIDGEREDVVGRIGMRKWMPIGGVAAAVVLSGLVWLVMGLSQGWMGLGKGVVWADVVDAVQEVESFHMTYFADEPMAMVGPEMVRGDVYFQWPNRWRVQGMGFVQFAGESGTKIYNITEGKFESAEETRFGLLSDRLLKYAEKGRLLDASLAILFGNEMVSAKAVRASDVVERAGVAVFDYSVGEGSAKARVWVVEDSKLPMMIKMSYPDDQAFVLINFDYTTRMPAKFFDVERFAKEMWSKESHEVYRWGME